MIIDHLNFMIERGIEWPSVKVNVLAVHISSKRIKIIELLNLCLMGWGLCTFQDQDTLIEQSHTQIARINCITNNQ